MAQAGAAKDKGPLPLAFGEEGECGDMKEACHMGGFFGSKAHKFKPRYDWRFPKGANFEGYGNPKSFMEKTYVCDVCTKCGAVVKRGEC